MLIAIATAALTATAQEPADTLAVGVEEVVEAVEVADSIAEAPGDDDNIFPWAIGEDGEEAPTIHLLGRRDGDHQRGLGGNPHFTFQYFKHIYGGMLWPRSAPETKLSYEVGIAQVAALQYKPSGSYAPRFSIGLGFGYRKISLDDGYRFDKTEGKLLLGAMPEGSYKSSSATEEWNIQVPVLITQKLYRRLSVMVGVIPTINFYSTAGTTYWLEDTRYTEKYKGLNQRILRAELIGGLGLRDIIGVYVRYCPTPLYRMRFGPRWETLSVGLTLNF